MTFDQMSWNHFPMRPLVYWPSMSSNVFKFKIVRSLTVFMKSSSVSLQDSRESWGLLWTVKTWIKIFITSSLPLKCLKWRTRTEIVINERSIYSLFHLLHQVRYYKMNRNNYLSIILYKYRYPQQFLANRFEPFSNQKAKLPGLKPFDFKPEQSGNPFP